jgi:GTP-binding protein EngB required for normal cell division
VKARVKNITNKYLYLTNTQKISYNLPPSKSVIDDFDASTLENLKNEGVLIEILDQPSDKIPTLEKEEKIEHNIEQPETITYKKPKKKK